MGSAIDVERRTLAGPVHQFDNTECRGLTLYIWPQCPHNYKKELDHHLQDPIFIQIFQDKRSKKINPRQNRCSERKFSNLKKQFTAGTALLSHEHSPPSDKSAIGSSCQVWTGLRRNLQITIRFGGFDMRSLLSLYMVKGDRLGW